MIKKVLTTSLGIASILLGTVVASPLKATAGQAVIEGSTPDSSGTSGDSFAPNVVTTNITTKVTGVTVSPNSESGTVILIVTQTIQTALNSFATTLLTETNVSTVRAEIRELFISRGKSVITVSDRIKKNWVSYGVREVRITTLLLKLSRCITVIQSSQPGIPVGQLSPEQLSASIKEIKANTNLAQSSDPAVVSVTDLNEAITEYNALVKESSGSTLKQLSQDADFKEISSILKEFREVLRTTG